MITITAPPPGTPIQPFDDLQVYVRATPPALERAVIFLDFPGLGRSELVHNGTQYFAPYGGSLRQAFTDIFGTGFQFTIRRDHGWPDGPIVRVVAYDVAGGEVIL